MIRFAIFVCLFFLNTKNSPQIASAQYYYTGPVGLPQSYIHQARYFGPKVRETYLKQSHIPKQEVDETIVIENEQELPLNNVALQARSNFGELNKKCRRPRGLDSVHEWQDLEYLFPTRYEYENAIRNRFYVERAGNPIDVDVERSKIGRRRVFVTVPRFNVGVPFTLGYVSETRRGPKGPALVPYPNYYWHSTTHRGLNCDGITSAFRVSIDACNRMWVIDTGRIGDIQYCPPQILVFDLATDTLFHRYKFPDNVYKSGQSLFIAPLIDTRDPPPIGNCLNTKVYIADVTAYGLVVYDSLDDASWRIEHETMRNTAFFSNFTIAGESFMLEDGIFGMSITPPDYKPKQRRFLFYHPLANNIEVIVPLDILDNRALWSSPNLNANSFQIVGRRNEQASAQAIDSRGNLFFGLVSSIGIGSWNYQKPWNGNSSAVIINPETLQFISGLKVIRNQLNEEELWIMSVRFQKIMAGTLNTNEVNFRIQKTPVKNLVC